MSIKRDDFPAIYENGKGDFVIVPDLFSGPVGFYRSKMSVEEFEARNAPPAEEDDLSGSIVSAPEPPAAPETSPPSLDPQDDAGEEDAGDEQASEDEVVDALAGWANS